MREVDDTASSVVTTVLLGKTKLVFFGNSRPLNHCSSKYYTTIIINVHN